MADLSLTAADVLPGAGAATRFGEAGAAIDAGEVVAKDASDGLYYPCDADVDDRKTPIGIAVCSASAGQQVVWQYQGTITLGSSAVTGLSAGATFFASDTAGGLAPEADLGTGDNVALVCVGSSTTAAKILIADSGVSHA